MMNKSCNRCHEVKPLDQFPKNKPSSDGYYSLCKVCQKVKKQEWASRPEVKAREAERLRLAYLKNKDAIDARRKERYAQNREKELARNATWTEANLEYHRQLNRDWSKNNPLAARALVARRRARLLAAGGTYTKADVLRMLDEQKCECKLCGCCLSINGYHVDHKHPLSKGGSNRPDNLQLLCPTCNKRKGAKLIERIAA